MVTIIIPTTPWTKEYFELCKKSIKENTHAFQYEIIEAPNGSGTDQPQGQNGAVNKAVKKAKGKWIMVTNDDMYYAPGWDNNFRFIGNCFSPNLLEPIKSEGSALPFLTMDGGFEIDSFKQTEIDEFIHSHRDDRVEDGFNLPFIMDRKLFNKIGGYDEMYDPWGSNGDSDLQYKVTLAGVKTKRDRNTLVYHFSMKSGTFNPENQDYWRKNFDYFTEKWGFVRADNPWFGIEIPKDELIYKPRWSKIK